MVQLHPPINHFQPKAQKAQFPAMKPLRKAFRLDGFDYKEVVRDGNIAVYEQSKRDFIAWEVIRIYNRPQRIIFGRVLEACEAYPGSESWGTSGWTCMTKERAFQKMDELLASTKQ